MVSELVNPRGSYFEQVRVYEARRFLQTRAHLPPPQHGYGTQVSILTFVHEGETSDSCLQVTHGNDQQHPNRWQPLWILHPQLQAKSSWRFFLRFIIVCIFK